MGSVGKKLKKVVKKVARPKVLLPLAALAIGGPMLAKGMAGSGAAGAGGGLSSFLFGNAGAAGTAGGSLIPISKASALSQGIATKGLLGAGGSFNPLVGTAAQFVKKGLMNPIKNPLAGAATYGGLAALGMGMLGGGKETPTGPTRQAQNLYNSFLQSGRLAGYTDDEINTIYAPYGDLAYGDYETVNVDRDPRRRQFPGTNYPIFAADGGRAGYADGKRVRKTRGYKPMAKNYDTYDDVVRELDDPILDRQQKEIIEQMREMGEFDYATGGRAGYAEGDVVNPMNRYGGPHKEEDIGIYDYLDARNERERISRELRAAQKAEAIERAKNMYDVAAERHEELTDMGFNVPPMKTIEEMFPKMDFNPSLYNNGGRVGYAEGELVSPEQILMVRPEKGGPIPDELVDRTRQKRMSLTGAQPPRPEEDEEIAEQILREILSPGVNEDSIADQMYNMQLQEMMNPRMGRADGGITQVAPGVPAGMELDYRNTGGFIPMGGPERADDVPAMLSRNEFVMTADAVRGMGNGDVNAGAQKMYDLMNNLEAKA